MRTLTGRCAPHTLHAHHTPTIARCARVIVAVAELRGLVTWSGRSALNKVASSHDATLIEAKAHLIWPHDMHSCGRQLVVFNWPLELQSQRRLLVSLSDVYEVLTAGADDATRH